MFVNHFLFIASNPFFDAYIHSDLLGKLIFIGLVSLSVITWILLIHKFFILYKARANGVKFYRQFQLQKGHLLNFEYGISKKEKEINPFFDLYQVFKKQTVEILNKNKLFGLTNQTIKDGVFLSEADINFVESHLQQTVSSAINSLEKHLFILSTIVSLAPFLGLLGTVWGILTTFSQLQSMTSGSTHQLVLGGLSLALATTVIGLIDAIPAMIGYNYFKNAIRDYEIEMQGFSTEILSTVEMHYRQVDVVYG